MDTHGWFGLLSTGSVLGLVALLVGASQPSAADETLTPAMAQGEQIARMRGLDARSATDPHWRVQALEQLRRAQRDAIAEHARDIQPAWAEIGPAPIRVESTSGPPLTESGRVTAIAVHPADADIVFVGTAGGGVFRSLDGGEHWTPLMDDAASLSIGALAIAPTRPNIVYVGTGEANFGDDSFFGVGVYRIDAADSSTPRLSGPYNLDATGSDVFSGRGIGAIRVDPNDADIIFVGTTSGIASVSAVQPDDLPARGLFRGEAASGNAPRFTRLTDLADNADVNVRDIALDSMDANVLIASVVLDGKVDGLYRSRNALAADPDFSLVHAMDAAPQVDANAMLAAYRDTRAGTAVFYAATGIGGGTVLRSQDGGVNWTARSMPRFCAPSCDQAIALMVAPANRDQVYLGGSAALVFGVSTNGGSTFEASDDGLRPNTHAIALAPSRPSTLYAGTDGGIYRSDDGGEHWRSLNNASFSATRVVGIATHPVHPNQMIAGSRATGAVLLGSENTWRLGEFGDAGRNAIDQNTREVARVRLYQSGANAPTRQGYATVAQWQDAQPSEWTFRGCRQAGQVRNGIACNGSVLYFAPLTLGPGNPNPVYFGSDRLYRSVDFGTTHTVVSQSPLRAGVPISAISIAPSDDRVRVVGLADGSLFRTVDGSSTLQEIDGLTEVGGVPDVYIGRIAISPVDANVAYIALAGFPGQGQTVWKTRNLLASKPSFAPSAAGLPNVPANALLIATQNADEIYLGTDIGVYRTLDGGQTWNAYSAGLPRVPVFDLAFQAAQRGSGRGPLRAATYGRGVWEIDARELPPERVYQDGFERAL
jgi:photosystem II stability/assembly factor-like uncharacterized protein